MAAGGSTCSPRRGKRPRRRPAAPQRPGTACAATRRTPCPAAEPPGEQVCTPGPSRGCAVQPEVQPAPIPGRSGSGGWGPASHTHNTHTVSQFPQPGSPGTSPGTSPCAPAAPPPRCRCSAPAGACVRRRHRPGAVAAAKWRAPAAAAAAAAKWRAPAAAAAAAAKWRAPAASPAPRGAPAAAAAARRRRCRPASAGCCALTGRRACWLAGPSFCSRCRAPPWLQAGQAGVAAGKGAGEAWVGALPASKRDSSEARASLRRGPAPAPGPRRGASVPWLAAGRGEPGRTCVLDAPLLLRGLHLGAADHRLGERLSKVCQYAALQLPFTPCTAKARRMREGQAASTPAAAPAELRGMLAAEAARAGPCAAHPSSSGPAAPPPASAPPSGRTTPPSAPCW